MKSHPKDLKEGAVREAATCGQCGKPFGQAGPIFYRLTVDHYMLDVQAATRQTGLAMMLGSAPLAMAMGPDEYMARILSTRTITVCLGCLEHIPSAGLVDDDEVIER